MKKFSRFLMVFAIALAAIAPLAAAPAFAQDPGDPYGLTTITDADNTSLALGSEQDPKELAVAIINIILGFLGLLAVVIILIGGFKWMTAGGNEENVTSAQKIIIAGVIGLVIIFAAWGIATFVIGQMADITGATTVYSS